MNDTLSNVIVFCPKHGEHEYAITSVIPGHEGAWCQLCWIETWGPSLPYKRKTQDDQYQTMGEQVEAPEDDYKTLPKNQSQE